MKRIVLPIGIGATAILNFLLYAKVDWKAYEVLFDTSVALVFAWLIASASRGFGGLLGSFLRMKPLVYLGKITYGIYVYHLFMPLIVLPLVRKIGISLNEQGPGNFIFSSAATVLVASLSWRFLESPMNNLKRFFEYRVRPTGSVEH